MAPGLLAFLLMSRVASAAVGALSDPIFVLEGEQDKHTDLLTLLDNPTIKGEMEEFSQSILRPIRYRKQVVNGLKFIVEMVDDESGVTYSVDILQKPYNSAQDFLPAPQLLKMMRGPSLEL